MQAAKSIGKDERDDNPNLPTVFQDRINFDYDKAVGLIVNETVDLEQVAAIEGDRAGQSDEEEDAQ